MKYTLQDEMRFGVDNDGYVRIEVLGNEGEVESATIIGLSELEKVISLLRAELDAKEKSM